MSHINFRKKQAVKALTLTAVLSTGGAVAWAATNSKLVMNGKVASTSVRVIDGAAYVRVSDVAKSMGMVVVKNGSGYEIKKAGGANQVGNLNGKVGDVLFDGKWRFQVLEMTKVDAYTIKAPTVNPVAEAWDLVLWDSGSRVMSARPNYQLVLFRCRVTNGQKTRQSLLTAPVGGSTNTALADTKGGSHIPAAYDFAGAPLETKAMLPGEILTFSLLFSVPQDTVLKDLVFSPRNNGWEKNDSTIRVSLAGT